MYLCCAELPDYLVVLHVYGVQVLSRSSLCMYLCSAELPDYSVVLHVLCPGIE